MHHMFLWRMMNHCCTEASKQWCVHNTWQESSTSFRGKRMENCFEHRLNIDKTLDEHLADLQKTPNVILRFVRVASKGPRRPHRPSAVRWLGESEAWSDGNAWNGWMELWNRLETSTDLLASCTILYDIVRYSTILLSDSWCFMQ